MSHPLTFLEREKHRAQNIDHQADAFHQVPAVAVKPAKDLGSFRIVIVYVGRSTLRVMLQSLQRGVRSSAFPEIPR